jgi:hypothetical protein
MIESLEFKPNLREAVLRMEKFWNMEELIDRIPIIIELPKSDARKADGSFFGKLDLYKEYIEEYFIRHSAVNDEFFPQVVPQYGHAIISALCGAEITAASHTVWSRPFIKDPAEAKELVLNWNNEWGRRFMEDYEKLIEKARGKYVAGIYETEGVSDTISAIRGSENMFYDFYEKPDEAWYMAKRVADILIEFTRWNNEHIAKRNNVLGGTVSLYSIWMPQGSCVTTEDASVMYSGEYYRKNIKEHTQRLASSFTKTLMEVHDEGTHQIREFGDTSGISIMAIGNPLKMKREHREDLKKLLGRVNFYIYIQPDEIEDVMQFTGIKGIMLNIPATSVKMAENILERVLKMTEKMRKLTVS